MHNITQEFIKHKQTVHTTYVRVEMKRLNLYFRFVARIVV